MPTPVDKNNNPDLIPLENASKMLGSIINKNNIIIYESTVYPGATEEFCVPILENESKLKFNVDFFCGYSPERINPGDNKHTLTSITKITSGSNEQTADFVDKLYKSIIKSGTHKASSIAVAESAKVIENIQRDVNIALMNEFAIIFDKLNLDTLEILEASGTKWNFLPFRPGLVGGHCIGVDPYYLTYKAAELGYKPEMVLAGRRINDNMAEYISSVTIKEIHKVGKNLINVRVAILGLTFKEDCPDLRNTKVFNIINILRNYNCEIIVTDEYAEIKKAKDHYDIDLVLLEKIKKVDVIIIAVAHDRYKSIKKKEWQKMFNGNGIIIDVKSIFEKDFFKNTDINHWRL